jgi:hypothetical protein
VDSTFDAEQLQRIADFHQERARLRILARGSMIWGGINTLIGGVALANHPINIILVLIGLFLLAEGIWFSIKPSAFGILVDALALMVVGFWNLFIVALELLAGVEPRVYWAILGIVFIGIALYRMMTFPRLYQLFQEPIIDEDLQHMDDLIRYLTKTKPKEAGDIIAFQTSGFMGQRQWRALLATHYALFLDIVGKKALVANRDEVTIEERGKVLLGSTLKVRLLIRAKRWNGLMIPAAFAKFQAWKLSDDRQEEEPLEAQPLPPNEGYTRRDQIQ